MENGCTDFLPRLEDAIARRAAWLESIRIPQLKNMVVTYRSLFERVVGTLIKKGLLRDDPYDYEAKVISIAVPADSAISQTEDYAELSRRIAAFRRQLDFLVDEMPFTLVLWTSPP